jgi:2-polyprenyl-6-methoxyphenol hydroxylase-like FAD-dependent oxidoreductase
VQPDVVIVGAGIGGAALGLALGRMGRRVALVEREATPPRLVRPEILWGATLDALAKLRVADRIRAEASVELEGVEVRSVSGPLITIGPQDLAAAGVRGFSTNPGRTRELLAEAALATGCVEVHRGVRVEDLARDGNRVVGISGKRGSEPFALGARLVVGDDGTHSVVRTRLGIPLTLTTFPIDFVTAWVPWPDPLPPGRVHLRLDPRAFRAGLPALGLFPWPRREAVVLVPLVHGRAERLLADDPERFWDGARNLTPLAPFLREHAQFPRDFARVQRPFGHAVRYVADGAAILGDAAHPMTPAGGQGANAAIWDALALADAADAALRSGDASRARLVEYERLRHPVNARSVAISAGVARLFRAARHLPLAVLVPFGARLADRLVWPKRRLVRGFATTFVTPRSLDRGASNGRG